MESYREYFQTLFNYHYWGRYKILRHAANLSEAEFTRTLSKGYGSLRATLVHCIGAEWIWLARWQGVPPINPPREEQLTTVDLIRERWQADEVQVRTFLKTLDDTGFSRVLQYTTRTGETLARPTWHTLTQIIEHGIQHRAEAAAMLTDLNQSPGNLDFLVFLDEQAK